MAEEAAGGDDASGGGGGGRGSGSSITPPSPWVRVESPGLRRYEVLLSRGGREWGERRREGHDGSPQANGARQAPAGRGSSGAPMAPAQSRRAGVSPVPGPPDRSRVLGAERGIPLLLVSRGCRGRGRPGGGRRAVRRDAPLVRIRPRRAVCARRLLRAGASAAACLPRAALFCAIILTGTSPGWVSRMLFRSDGFVGRGKRGDAAGGAPRFVCAGSVVAQPSPSRDSHRSPEAAVSRPPVSSGGSRTWNAGGGLCGCG